MHRFVVRELPRLGQPMSPEYVSSALGMNVDKVVEILDELERRLIFVYRPDGRDVVWAYPVTTEPTPHRLDFAAASGSGPPEALTLLRRPSCKGNFETNHSPSISSRNAPAAADPFVSAWTTTCDLNWRSRSRALCSLHPSWILRSSKRRA